MNEEQGRLHLTLKDFLDSQLRNKTSIITRAKTADRSVKMLRNWKEEDLKPKGFTFNHNEALTFHNETKEKIARAKMSLIESLDN